MDIYDFYNRMANLTIIMLGPKFIQYKGKYGKYHASKEKLYTLLGTFMAPKASPLNASIVTFIRLYNDLTIGIHFIYFRKS